MTLGSITTKTGLVTMMGHTLMVMVKRIAMMDPATAKMMVTIMVTATIIMTRKNLQLVIVLMGLGMVIMEKTMTTMITANMTTASIITSEKESYEPSSDHTSDRPFLPANSL